MNAILAEEITLSLFRDVYPRELIPSFPSSPGGDLYAFFHPGVPWGKRGDPDAMPQMDKGKTRPPAPGTTPASLSEVFSNLREHDDLHLSDRTVYARIREQNDEFVPDKGRIFRAGDGE